MDRKIEAITVTVRGNGFDFASDREAMAWVDRNVPLPAVHGPNTKWRLDDRDDQNITLVAERPERD